MTKDEALKLALEALEEVNSWESATRWNGCFDEEITSLRQAIAEAEKQEPVLKPCWYESKEKTMCRKCGQVHAEAILPNQEKQEPVAWMYVNKDGECEQIEYGEAIDDPSVTLLYDHPQPKREPLTDDEFISMIDSLGISIDPVLAFEIKEIVETA